MTDLCFTCIYMRQEMRSTVKMNQWGHYYQVFFKVKYCDRTLNPTTRAIRRTIIKCPHYQNRRLTEIALP